MGIKIHETAPNRGENTELIATINIMLNRMNMNWKLSILVSLFVLTMLLASSIIIYLFDNFIFPPETPAIYRIIPLIIIVGITLGASVLFARGFITRYIKNPLDTFDDGLYRLAEKEFDYRLAEDESTEFGLLASSFNDMASMFESSMNELKKNRDYVASILESSADIIITVSASGKISTINGGAEKALGYNRLEVIGKPIEMVFANPDDRAVAIGRLEETDSVVNYETRFLTKEGKIRDVLLTISRLRNPAGEVIGTIGISKDITEEKYLQHQLLQSQRYIAIGQVFTGIQHSMKNYLNACKGGAYMVKLGLSKDKKDMLVEGWDIVQQGISSLTNMSMDMLRYVKDWKPSFNEVDLNHTLEKIHKVVSQTASDKGIELKFNPTPDLPPVIIDDGMVHSAIMDIVSNALDACLWKSYDEGDTPEVKLGVHLNHEGRNAVVEISDNGCGMDEDVIEQIFNPFFSTKSKAGTGLGLAITSRMIDAHNGKVEVESEPDVGTTFRIMLPVSKSGN